MSKILISLLCAFAAEAGRPASLEPLLEKIAAYEYGQSREPLVEFDAYVRGSLARGEKLDGLEMRLIQFLKARTTLAAKDFACRELSLIGTAASAPALAAMLPRAETSEMARYALERIPGPEAAEALRKALPGASGRTRVGIVNSLGERRDARAVPLLRPLVISRDAAVAEAAAAALGKIGGKTAAAALDAALARTSDPQRTRVAAAYIRCAEGMAAGGDRAGALRIYERLGIPGEPPMIRVAALRGLARTAGKGAIGPLSREIESSNRLVQTAAIRFLAGIPGPEATAALVEAVPRLPAEGRVIALSALVTRGDAAGRQLLVDALNSGAPAVRLAALEGLGKLGDESSVLVLAGAAATREGAEQAAARESLYALGGAGIDPAIVKAIGSTEGKVRIELIRAAGERGIAAATDALLAGARDPDREIRRESVRALRETAGISSAKSLLDLMLAAEGASERREMGRTLAAVLKKSGNPPIGLVVAAYQSAQAIPLRAALLEVIGQTGSGDALPVLRSGLQADHREISRTAILALSDWPTPAPMSDLLPVARSDPDPANQVLALRGYLKLVALPSGRTAAETARLLSEAMALAKQPGEKKAVLALLPGFPCQESLQVARASLGDATVAGEARMAVDRISRALSIKKESR